MDRILQNWPVILFTITCLSGLLGSFYVAGKKIRNFVCKHELYQEDGRPIYQHRKAYQEDMRELNGGLKEIKESIDGLAKKIQRDRITSTSFMSAVKEKLKLEFTIPKD